MSIYQNEESWPTLNIQWPEKGGYLKTTNGKIIGYIMTDGSHKFFPGCEVDIVAAWQPFGINDPQEIQVMQKSVDDLISRLTQNYENTL